MPISEDQKENFETLRRAFEQGRAVLLECQDKKTKKPVIVIMVRSDKGSDGKIPFTPFAKMFDGDPYDELNPPNPILEGGFLERGGTWNSA